jgi:TRAP-type uncharacterized transport system fused permease subunit
LNEENAATAPRLKALRIAVALIAIAMSLYHMHAAAFGPPEALIFRGTHLLFAVTLVFLLYPTLPGGAWPGARSTRC